MLIKQFLTGGDRNFGYLIGDEESGAAAVVDPSYAPDVIDNFAMQHKFSIVWVLNTHSHYDHTNGNEFFREKYGLLPVGWGLPVFRGKSPLQEETTLPVGNLQIEIIHTPGHTRDSICFLVSDVLLTGDTLFVGKVGGTDFGEQAREEYDSLHQKILALPDKTRVFPGHNYGVSPESTIGRERKENPFLVQPDFDSFLNLKKNWASYKKKHGIQ